MKCYICETTDKPGGTRYSVADAVSVCHNCGIGVCGTQPEIFGSRCATFMSYLRQSI